MRYCWSLLACSAVCWAAPIIGIAPSPKTVTVGTAFALDVFVTGVSDLYAFQFDLGYDPAVLTATGIVEGAFLGTGGATFFIGGTIDNGAGSILFSANTLLTAIGGVNGAGVLARIGFVATGVGPAQVNLSGVVLLDSSLSGIAADLAPGAVEVTGATVPEPRPALAMAVLGLALARRVRGRRSLDLQPRG